MTRRLWLLIVLGLCVLGYRGYDLYHALVAPRGVSFAAVALAPAVEGLRVVQIQRADALGDELPLWKAGLRRDDVIVGVRVGDGRAEPVRSLESLAAALRGVDRTRSWAIEVRREGVPDLVRLHVEPRLPSKAAIATHVVAAGFLPLLAVSTALLIGVLRPDDERSFYGGLLFLGFSAVSGADFSRFPQWLRLASQAVHTLVTIVGVYAFMHFFLVFPTSAGLDRLVPWVKPLGRAVTLAAVAVAVVSLVVAEFAPPSWVETLQWLAPSIDPFVGWSLVVMMVVGFVSLIWHTVRAETRSDRRRMRVLLAGALVGLVPLLVLVLWTSAGADSSPPVWLVIVLLVGLPFFPLSFIYAVVRHRVLGVQLIVRRGVRYALVSKGFLLLETLLILLGLFFIVGPLVRRFVPPGDQRALILVVAVGAGLLLYASRHLNKRLQPWIDRRFFREPYVTSEVLAEFAGLSRAHAADTDALIRDALRIIIRALHPVRAAVFLGDVDQGEAAAPAGTAGPLRCRAHLETDSVARTVRERACVVMVPADGPLATEVERRSAQGQDVLAVDWTDPRSWLRPLAAPTSEAERHDHAVLEAFDPALVVPLSTGRGLMGWILVGDKLSEEAFTREDRQLLAAVAKQMATALDYANLVASVADQEALRRELEFARQVQEGLYPQTRPPLTHLEYEGACRMARGVGGDYFDFLALAPGKVGFALGDISGKGMSAALLMASLQAMLRSRAPLMVDVPAGFASALNDQLVASTASSKFATLFYGVFDDETCTLEYVNAGHNPPMLVRRATGRVERLPPTGMALGLVAQRPYDARRLSLDPGDLLVVFSDGITEAMNVRYEELGEARLEEHLAGAVRGSDLGAVVAGIFALVDRWLGDEPAQDDATVLVLRRR